MSTTEIEKKNLEAHVEICAERYKNLENKLQTLDERIDNLDGRMDKFEEHLVDIKNAVTATDVKHTDKTVTILMSVFGIVLAALIGIFASGLLK
jgi:predicted nuclease with TOPRIM domain